MEIVKTRKQSVDSVNEQTSVSNDIVCIVYETACEELRLNVSCITKFEDIDIRVGFSYRAVGWKVGKII